MDRPSHTTLGIDSAAQGFQSYGRDERERGVRQKRVTRGTCILLHTSREYIHKQHSPPCSPTPAAAGRAGKRNQKSFIKEGALRECTHSEAPLGEPAPLRYSTTGFDRRETPAMATPHVTLTQLAQQAAAQIGFTARRWWRDATDPAVLRVEVERRLVGAPPAVAELTVAIPPAGVRPRSGPAATPTPARTRFPTRPTRQPPRGRGSARARKA
jgi:hypothetical protein